MDGWMTLIDKKQSLLFFSGQLGTDITCLQTCEFSISKNYKTLILNVSMLHLK